MFFSLFHSNMDTRRAQIICCVAVSNTIHSNGNSNWSKKNIRTTWNGMEIDTKKTWKQRTQNRQMASATVNSSKFEMNLMAFFWRNITWYTSVQRSYQCCCGGGDLIRPTDKTKLIKLEIGELNWVVYTVFFKWWKNCNLIRWPFELRVITFRDRNEYDGKKKQPVNSASEKKMKNKKN